MKRRLTIVQLSYEKPIRYFTPKSFGEFIDELGIPSEYPHVITLRVEYFPRFQTTEKFQGFFWKDIYYRGEWEEWYNKYGKKKAKRISFSISGLQLEA